MSEPLLKVVQLRKSFGGVVATDSLDFDVMPGEIHAVIGPNGAGKTTFVAQIAGMLKSDSGTITFDGKDIAGKNAPERSHMGLARSFQITSVFRDFTALENVSLSIQAHAGHSFRFWKRASTDRDLTDPAQKILDDVGLGDKALTLAGSLAHMASSASSKSRWRWRPARRCCCSMSRRRAWAPRNRRPCGPFSTR